MTNIIFQPGCQPWPPSSSTQDCEQSDLDSKYKSSFLLLSIIIVSYNTKQLTLQAVKSVLKAVEQSQLLAGRSEIWVVDNNSQDQTVTELRRLQLALQKKQQQRESLKQTADFCPIHLITNQNNPGFAVANNQAIKHSSGQYILLLNSDTIVQPGALTQMLRTFQHYSQQEVTAQLSSYQGKLDKLGILAATLLNPDQTIQPQGGSFPNLFTAATHWLMWDDLPLLGKFLPSTQHTGLRFNLKQVLNSKQPQQKDWVAGTAMMINREVITEIGDLDSNIFMYGEDMEYCLRARRHHWDIALDPQAKVIHLGSASSSTKQAILGEIKGLLYLWAKYKPDWQMPVLKSLIWWGCVVRIFLFGTILSRRQNSQKQVKAYRQALNLL